MMPDDYESGMERMRLANIRDMNADTVRRWQGRWPSPETSGQDYVIAFLPAAVAALFARMNNGRDYIVTIECREPSGDVDS